MEQRSFDYINLERSSQFDFIRIPKAMITSEGFFVSMSLQSKLLYGLLLDRMTVSMKNKWLDDRNRAYIVYPIKEIQNDLSISRRKAIDSLTELEDLGLVEKKQRGQGRPSIIYVKNFICEHA